MSYKVVPIEGQNVDGRQYGWQIQADGLGIFDCFQGSTGACWNLSNTPSYNDEDPDDPIHICDLDEAIQALEALRDSDAHKQNVERWS